MRLLPTHRFLLRHSHFLVRVVAASGRPATAVALPPPRSACAGSCHRRHGRIAQAPLRRATLWSTDLRPLLAQSAVLRRHGQGECRHRPRLQPGAWAVSSPPALPAAAHHICLYRAQRAAALGLGELIELTSSEGVKPFISQIAGPLIRILGDRFPAPVKSAILSTLRSLLCKAGKALKTFVPQLQSSFVKALSDPNGGVRLRAGSALAALMTIAQRVDPLVADLLRLLSSSAAASSASLPSQAAAAMRDADLLISALSALRGVVLEAGQSVSAASLTAVWKAVQQQFLPDPHDGVRASAAQVLAAVCLHLGSPPPAAAAAAASAASSSSSAAADKKEEPQAAPAPQAQQQQQQAAFASLVSSLLSQSADWKMRQGSVDALRCAIDNRACLEKIKTAVPLQTISQHLDRLVGDENVVVRASVSSCMASLCAACFSSALTAAAIPQDQAAKLCSAPLPALPTRLTQLAGESAVQLAIAQQGVKTVLSLCLDPTPDVRLAALNGIRVIATETPMLSCAFLSSLVPPLHIRCSDGNAPARHAARMALKAVLQLDDPEQKLLKAHMKTLPAPEAQSLQMIVRRVESEAP